MRRGSPRCVDLRHEQLREEDREGFKHAVGAEGIHIALLSHEQVRRQRDKLLRRALVRVLVRSPTVVPTATTIQYLFNRIK